MIFLPTPFIPTFFIWASRQVWKVALLPLLALSPRGKLDILQGDNISAHPGKLTAGTQSHGGLEVVFFLSKHWVIGIFLGSEFHLKPFRGFLTFELLQHLEVIQLQQASRVEFVKWDNHVDVSKNRGFTPKSMEF